jgi:molecular chaperone DnaK
MTDVNPYSLGTRCRNDMTDDYFSVIIPRNVTIPTSRTERYYTCYPGQTAVDVDAYQGESSIASHNHFLGSFRLDGIPPRDEPESIDITFSYNLNGMLDVSAKVVSTGKNASISINMQNQEKEDLIDISDDDDWKNSPIASNYRAIIRRAERAIDRLDDDELVIEIEDLLDDLKDAISRVDTEDADDFEQALIEVLESPEV